MRHIVPIIALLALPAVMLAEEAAATPPADTPQWLSILMTIISTAVLPFVIKFLNRKADESKKKAEAAELESSSTLVKVRNEFIDLRLIPFLYSSAAHLAETRLPSILKDASDGGGFDWKAHLKALKDELLDLTKEKFAAEGIDIVKNLGEKYLDSLLDRALAKAIPFLPEFARPIAEEKGDDLTDKLSGLIMDKGLDYAKKWVEKKKAKEVEAED